jgi:integrase
MMISLEFCSKQRRKLRLVWQLCWLLAPGLRLGEVPGLKWVDMDLDEKISM